MTTTPVQSPSTLERAVDEIATVRIPTATNTAEGRRLLETFGKLLWRRWGPYVSERSWGTFVRTTVQMERPGIFSPTMRPEARLIAGVKTGWQRSATGISFWSSAWLYGMEEIRFSRSGFGLTPSEGNHGEDVKDYYFYLDSTPTHSYMKYLYKYPQAAYPYEWLLQENRNRCGRGFEFELLDTGIFDENRYFDIFVEYAKDLPKISASVSKP